MENNYYNYNPYSNNETNTDTTNQSSSNAEYTNAYNKDNYNNHSNSYNGSYGYTNGNSGTTPPPARKKSSNFGTKLAKCAALALVFGTVGGVGFTGVTYFGGNALGIFSQADKNESNKISEHNIGSVLEDKQEKEDKNEQVENGLQQTDTENNTSVAIMDVSAIVKDAMPCVVAITNTSEVVYQSMWGQQFAQESESCGTGFLVEQDSDYLYIATNSHVVSGAKELTVQFSDDTFAAAEIKGTVASKDLAVIKVALKDISEETKNIIRLATLGDSNEMEMGEGAIAIGNALGYGQSVTTGVISALGRSVTVSDGTTGSAIVCNNLIQTNAAINPGNSGGPLLNINGEVIGINSVKYADTDVEGIGYAIPISDAMIVIDKLIDGEQIESAKSGYLGIQGKDIEDGVYVYKVFAGSAAEEAGIRAGDIIVGFEGNSISTMSQLKELLSYYPAGEEVEFVIYHAEGNEYVQKTIQVVLGDSSSIQQQQPNH
ncbi:MAG: trypsin-like peptidase domain-containing protein [Lachnospiraceae bacterium]|nr:trypsin-like peptidase domain-containing protein [Lachnospiraceae bacterium]